MHWPLLPASQQNTEWSWRDLAYVLKPRDYSREPEQRAHVEIARYTYSDLLSGLLVEPADSSQAAGELFHGYRQRQVDISREFERMREEAGLADAECWSHPVG
jgi:hypothetical protein